MDWFSDRMDIGTKSVNFELRQSVPIPDIMGTDGQWDVWVDLRNALNQGKETLAATDGELFLTEIPVRPFWNQPEFPLITFLLSLRNLSS